MMVSHALLASTNNSLLCNGSTQYVSVPANTNLTPTPLTFEAWVNPSVATCNTILSRGDGGGQSDFIFTVGYNGSFCGVMNAAFWGAGAWDASASVIPLNAWTHVAVTFDGTNKQFYLNGALDRIVARPGTLYQSGTAMYLGRQGTNCNCNSFHGLLGEVRIWNTIRTPSEITADMAFSSGAQPGLVAYYPLDEGSGTNAFDASGNGNDGTLNGGATWANSGPPASPPPISLGGTNFLLGPAAGTASVNLSVSIGASATNNAPWLHASPTNKSGFNLLFNLDANTGLTRTGTLTIAGQTVTVQQAGSGYVAASGLATLVASGTNSPQGLAMDGIGNVYFADSGSGAIKKWVAASNSVVTLVSTGLASPNAVALDGAGNIYICDQGHQAIKELVLSNNTVITLVSTGLTIPAGLAVDRAGNVLIGDARSNVVKLWNTATNGLSTLFSLTSPFGVTVDASGVVYVANGGGVWKWTAASGLSQVVPSSVHAIAVAVDGGGNVYFADNFTHTVGEWIAASNIVVTLASTQNGPTGLALDPAGNLFSAQTVTNVLEELPHAFVNATPKIEIAGVGNDTLPVVVPSTASLLPNYFPTSSQPWVTVTGFTNGIVSFSYTENGAISGIAYLNVLGQPVEVIQMDGYSFRGNGTNQYVSVPANPSFTPTQLTFEAWVNPSAATCNTILSRGDGSNGGLTDYIFDVGYDGATCGVMKMGFFGVGVWDASASTIPLNTWTHVAVTFDGTNKQFYINGMLDRTAPRPGLLYQSGSALYIGRQGSSCNCNYFNGALAEVRIWDTVRSASQIAADMSYSSGAQPGLAAYYHFNEGSGVNAMDASGQGHNGLVALGTSWTNSVPTFPGWLTATNLVEAPAAGTDSVFVSVFAGWIATNNASWLHLSPTNQSGMGAARVTFSFDGNTGATRTGTLTIADQTLTVTQAGSNYVAAPAPVAPLVASGLNDPWGMAVDRAGNVYFADLLNNALKEWLAASNTVISLVSTGLSFPSYPALDTAGNVYFSDRGNHALKEWVAASNTVVTLVSSGLQNPTGVAVDLAGNVYVADFSANALKEWVAANNSLITLVSSGLTNPEGVAVDVFGNVYVCSIYNNTIQEWLAASNTLVTLISSGLNQPYGVALDVMGNVFISDTGHAAIKEWIAASNTLTTLSSSGVGAPSGVAVDGMRDVYIADYNNQAIKVLPRAFLDPTPRFEPRSAGSDALPPVVPVTAEQFPAFAPVSDQSWLTLNRVSNGIVSFAFSQNIGPARTAHVTVLGQDTLITQSSSSSLFFNGTNQFVTVPASPSLTPTPVTFEAWVNPSVATCNTILSRGDGGGFTDYVLQIGYDGTSCSSMKLGFFGAGGWDFSASSIALNTWTHVAVTYDGAQKKFYINGQLDSTADRAGSLNQSGTNMFLGRQGTVCNCSYFNGQLAEVRLWNVTRSASQVSADMGFFPGPERGLVTYYHLNEGGGTIANDASGNGHNGTLNSGAGWTNSPPPLPGILGVAGLVEGPAAGVDSVVLSDFGGWTVTNNTTWLQLNPANPSGFGNTNLFFNFSANTGATRTGTLGIAGRTLSVTQAGAAYVAAPAPVTTLANSGSSLFDPVGVAVDGAGNVFTADTGHNLIKEWLAASNAVISLVSTGLASPFYPTLDAAGNVYFSDHNHVALKEWVAASNTVVTLVSSGLVSPAGVAVDWAGNVYVADGNTLKEWVAASNSLVTLVSSGLTNPMGITVDVSGNIYLACPGSHAIFEWFSASNSLVTLVSSGLGLPYDVKVDGGGNLYIADPGANAILQWSPAGGTLTTLVSSGLKNPFGVAVDAAGNIYIADSGNNALKELPRAFVDPTPKFEAPGAGSDFLPAVLPATADLLAPFGPGSDQSWLTINGASNDVVSFSFPQNSGTLRTAHVNVLGQSVPITQYGSIGLATSLTGAQFLTNGSFQFTFTNLPGGTYTVLGSTNISLPIAQWTPLGAPTENPPGQYQFTDPAPTNSTLFYILLSP